jgi:glycosyltransferase involved in cell wall biosynthesis
MGKKPLLTIITVVLNGAETLEQTIKSVLAFKTPEVEYVIKDGGSTDGTLEIINNFNHVVDKLITCPDKGIYDAMNQAWDAAGGAYVFNLNIGDVLLDLPLDDLKNSLDNEIDVLSYPVSLSNGTTFIPRLGYMARINNTLHHQGTFYRNNRAYRYNSRYRVFADFDLNQRLIKAGKKIKLFRRVVCFHDIVGVSHNIGHFHEVYSIISDNFGVLYRYIAFLNFKRLGLKKWMRI